jgi:hypothetical protein
MKKRTKSKAPRRRNWPAVVACVGVLACGFFFAARQHFSSMDFGMKNSRLRKQIDDLESEKRRLLLAREISLSPNEIKKAAAKVGSGMADAAVEIASAASAVKDKLTTANASLTKSAPTNPLIQKTVASASTQPKAIQASLQKPAVRSTTVDKKLVARVTTAAE